MNIPSKLPGGAMPLHGGSVDSGWEAAEAALQDGEAQFAWILGEEWSLHSDPHSVEELAGDGEESALDPVVIWVRLFVEQVVGGLREERWALEEGEGHGAGDA